MATEKRIGENSSYTLILNSNDKISGTNNNGTYYVDWNAFLPTTFDRYKIVCSLQTQGGSYSDGTNYYLTGVVGTTTLNGAITSTATTITATASTGFNISGYILIDSEYIQYQSIVNNVFTTLTRGALSTSAASHSTNAVIYGCSAALTGSKCIFSTAKVLLNLNTKSYTFDTSTKGQTNTIGFIQRDIQSTTTTSNTLSCFYLQNPPITIQRPNNNFITLSIYNSFFSNNSQLLTDGNLATPGTTSSVGLLSSDMSSFTALLEFIPIEASVNKTSFNV